MFVETSFILFGIIGLLIRRNLIAIGFCYILIFSGLFLWLKALGAIEIAWLLSFMFSLQLLIFGAVSVFVWRNHGTLHIDELRELRT